MGSKVPQLYKIGGNTNGVNTFTGIDLSSIFGSAYSLPNLLSPARMLCFFYRSILAVTPDMIQGGIVTSLLSTGLNILNSYVLPLVPVDPLCPSLTYNGYLLDSYPGASVG